MQIGSDDIRHREVLAGVAESASEIQMLPGGSSGRSYRLSVDGVEVVAKFFDPQAQVLLGPAEQFELLQTLAATGIAPRPIACFPDEGLLLTEFLESADAGDSVGLMQPATLAAVAALLRELHSIPADLAAFDPVTCARRYVDACGGERSLGDAERALFEQMVELAEDPVLKGNALCHNDLLADNICFGNRPRLIDFDFAATAAPIIDLASLVVMNKLDETAATALVNYYAGPEWPFTESSFHRVQRMHRLLAHFWARAAGESGAAIVAQYRLGDD